MKFKLLVLLLLVQSIGFAETETVRIKRSKASELVYYITKPEGSTSYPVLIQINGAGCGLVKGFHDGTFDAIKSILNVALITVEKRGNSNNPNCSEEYKSGYTIQDRVNDHLLVLKSLKKDLSWNKQVAIFGISEGSYVTSQLASKVKGLVAIGLIAGPGAYTFEKNLSILGEKNQMFCPEMNALGIEGLVLAAKKKSKTSEFICHPAFTYRLLNSWFKVDPVKGLKKVSEPIFMAHGLADTTIIGESGTALKEAFAISGRSNMESFLFENYDHGFTDHGATPPVNHFGEVMTQYFNWLKLKTGW